LPASVLDQSLLAAMLTRKAKEVYDLFSPYYLVPAASTKKRSDPAMEKRETIRDIISTVADRRYYAHDPRFAAFRGEETQIDKFIKAGELDPRWLDAAIESNDLDLVQSLARPKHKGAGEYLSRQMEALLKKRDFDYELSGVLETMLRIEHPQATEYYLAALRKIGSGRAVYYAYWLARLIPNLPKSAAPQIEALLPTVNEKIADQIAPYLSELQTKA
jgi:hypothetical protein